MTVSIIILSIFTLICIAKMTIANGISKTVLISYLVYCGIWFGVSSMNPYDLYAVSDSVYFMQFSGIIMFALGFTFCGEMKTKNNLTTMNMIQLNLDKYKAVPVVLFPLVLLLAYYLIKYYSLVGIYGGNEARIARFTAGGLFNSEVEALFFNYVIYPVEICCMVIIADSIVAHKRFTITFYLSLVYIILYTLIGSGREMMIILPIFMILLRKIYIIRGSARADLAKDNMQNVNAVKSKSKFILLILIFIPIFALVAFIMIYLTMVRLDNNEINYENMQSGFDELCRQFVIYFVGPFRAFELALNNNYLETSGYLLGRATFAGIDDLIGVLLICFGIKYNSANSIIASLLQENQINIGTNVDFNFAYTNLMIYYFDFGMLGIVLFSFLFGYFVRKSINYFQNNPNFFSLTIVLFLFYAMLFSAFKWSLQSSAAVILIAGAYYFSRRNTHLAAGKTTMPEST